jgi:ribonuclease inhibitor
VHRAAPQLVRWPAQFMRGVIRNMPSLVAIDISQAKSKLELHNLLAESLSFPSFYGKNWDAFWDAITGLVEMPEILELHGIDQLKKVLPKEAVQLVTCLDDLGKDYPEIQCDVRYV